MTKKNTKAKAQRRAKQLMKKRAKLKLRQKTRVVGHLAMTENAIQHQMLSEFGNVENFVRNIGALAELMREDEDLKTLRYDADKVYEGFDLAADRDALEDLYSDTEDFTYYGEDFQDFWRDKRRDILKDLVTEELIERADKILKKLLLTKKGHKKEYRAVMAGQLLVRSHRVALSPTDAPLEDNNLWELILLATLKENPRDLPEPAPAENGDAEDDETLTEPGTVKGEDETPEESDSGGEPNEGA
ncbi:MAG: hypothetical protein P9L99_06790 [Candidatus Lernaella stagnicola]|nr:hypothetical protein [Candidatus Lernaella stagnicola]